MKIGLVVPHIFMQDRILPNVIFSPGPLAIDLAENLHSLGQDVTLYTPGRVKTTVKNEIADLRLFQKELKIRGDTYIELLKKHPFTFVTLARQVQSEIVAKAFTQANEGLLDIVHIYANEEDIALPYAQLCTKPVVFTHHDPFNFLVKYKSVFPKYPHLNWISLSLAQRSGMPKNTNWVGNVYHGLPQNQYEPSYDKPQNYLAYFGRIIQSKGVHLAIKAVQEYNKSSKEKVTLKIAGKHYTGKKDSYWQEKILPELKDPNIEYVGFLKTTPEKQKMLAKAKALIIPSVYAEPFGMVMLEALACGTPIIGLNSGAIPEVVNKENGILVKKTATEYETSKRLAKAITAISKIDRHKCREQFEKSYTSSRMAKDYLKIYQKLVKV